MAIIDAYESPEHHSNVGHFAAMVRLARVDDPINREEEMVLKRLAFKLDISREEVKIIWKHPERYPLIPPYGLEDRIERLHELFAIIYADDEVDEEERKLIFKYAIGLGFSNERANREIEKCIKTMQRSMEPDE